MENRRLCFQVREMIKYETYSCRNMLITNKPTKFCSHRRVSRKQTKMSLKIRRLATGQGRLLGIVARRARRKRLSFPVPCPEEKGRRKPSGVITPEF